MLENKTKVVFGLEAQGHIKTIEAILEKWNANTNMTYEKCVWEEVGEAIGWEAFSACLAYFKWKEKKDKLKNNPSCDHLGDFSLTDWHDSTILCLKCNSVVSDSSGNNLDKPIPLRVSSYS